jgi:hypothetical protein
MDDRRWTIVGHNLLAMFGTQHLTLFIVSGILLNLTPGQDTFYIVGRSVSQGRRAGILSVLGIVPGVPFTLLPLHSVCRLCWQRRHPPLPSSKNRRCRVPRLSRHQDDVRGC